MASKSDDKKRALALSSRLGRTALVFDENDVLAFLRIAIEGEGSQSAFARHHGVSRPYLNRVLRRERSVGDAVAEALGFRKAYILK